jgi:RNA polymerase sigma-70 factor (ECF subfamily)
MMSDQEIIMELKSGNLQGLETLVDRYQLTAIRAAFLILQDEEAAKDIAADGFLRAYKNINKFDPERPFAPWLYTIVTNLARRSAVRERKLFSREPVDLENHPSRDIGLENYVENNEDQEAVRKAISMLNARQRTILTQRYYLEMSIKEISRAQHMPEGTVKWQLSQARHKLKNQLNLFFQKD